MPPRGTMKITDDDPHLQRLVAAATRQALEPWLRPRVDLKRAQRILHGAGYKALADGLQPFIDEPPLPLGRRK